MIVCARQGYSAGMQAYVFCSMIQTTTMQQVVEFLAVTQDRNTVCMFCLLILLALCEFNINHCHLQSTNRTIAMPTTLLLMAMKRLHSELSCIPRVSTHCTLLQRIYHNPRISDWKRAALAPVGCNTHTHGIANHFYAYNTAHQVSAMGTRLQRHVMLFKPHVSISCVLQHCFTCISLHPKNAV